MGYYIPPLLAEDGWECTSIRVQAVCDFTVSDKLELTDYDALLLEAMRIKA